MEKSSINIFDENYSQINNSIAVAAKKAGKTMDDITLLAATKTVDVEVINHAIDSGIKVIGENKVQEFLSKFCTFSLKYVYSPHLRKILA